MATQRGDGGGAAVRVVVAQLRDSGGAGWR